LIGRVAVLPLVGALLAGAAVAQQPEKLAPYYPTPEKIVEEMLKFGDGRIVIMAARKFRADATGVEFDDDLWRQSSERIKSLGLESHARIVHGDLMKQDYSSADVLTVYLLPGSNDKLRPLLEKQLRKGARIVAHDFEFSAWTPEATKYIEDDGQGRSHTLYLYRR
jgi:tRNA1(Val) A37 N6-methylase TrmN6